MTQQQILEKGVQKAIDAGWQPLEGVDIKIATFEFNERITRVIWRYKGVTALEEMSVYGVIFDHDFAKALWGDWEMSGRNSGAIHWKYQLQQMVIADDPIAYLGANL